MARWSKQTYELIAFKIAAQTDYKKATGPEVLAWLARSLADEFERDNPRFNREKFLSAAGVGAR